MTERKRKRPESLLGDETADAGCAEIAERGTTSWDQVKAGLGIESARFNVKFRASFAEILSGSRRAVDRAERGRP